MQRFVQRNTVFGVELVQRLVKGAHANLGAACHRFLDARELAFGDQVGDVGRVEHHFHGRHQLFVQAGNQPLRHHARQVQAQVHQQLPVRFFGEEVDHPLHRLVGIVGVQCGQAQVPRFGVGNCLLHGVAVADLADHDHVGRLAQGVFQGFFVRMGVNAHLALVYHRELVGVQKLQRVFNGEDVARGVFVAVVEHGRQRGRFARTRGARHQHQAALAHHQLFQHRRQAQGSQRRNLVLDVANHHAGFAALHEHVHPEAPQVFGRDREIHLHLGFELADLALIHHRIGQLLDLPRAQRGHFQRVGDALDLQVDGGSHTEEQIRACLLDHEIEEAENFHARISHARVSLRNGVTFADMSSSG